MLTTILIFTNCGQCPIYIHCYTQLLYTIIIFITALLLYNNVTYCFFMIYTNKIYIEWTKCATNISKPNLRI